MNKKENAAEEIEDAGSHPLKALGSIKDGDADELPQWTNEEERKLVYVCQLLF